MKIVLLVKQVPESGAVKMDEATGTVIRRAADAVINPLDLYAVEAALQLRERLGGAEITVFSMGPAAAEKALREVLALGADTGFLVSDRAFGGSDTWATARILSSAIRRFVPDFDLILCGERATDGDTGQVGPAVAAALNLPVATYINAFGACAAGELELFRRVERGVEHRRVKLPALLTVVKAVGVPRLPTLAGCVAARQAELHRCSQTELQLAPDEIGLAGSPTRVVKIFHPRLSRHGVTTAAPAAEAVAQLAGFLHNRGVNL